MPTTASILAITPVLVNGALDIITMPLTTLYPWYTFTTTLSGTVYTMRMRYNPRMSRWILDVADAQNNDIINGIPLLVQANLLAQYSQSNLPTGLLWVVDNTGQNTQPTRYSWAITHSLLYYDPYGTT